LHKVMFLFLILINSRRANRRRTDLDDHPQNGYVFDDVIPDKIFQQVPIKREMLVTVGSDRQQNKINAKLTLLVARSHMLKHQIDVQVINDNDEWGKVNLI